ncbi:MAG: hypothetical protein MZV70_02625 [Desulfobacterales bacterium]|nr:hypothetical protein [Desulfobacterales bacterium]
MPLLVSHFLKKFNDQNNKFITSIESDVMEAFMEHDWPGNVREIENVIERAVVLCPTDVITMRFLPRAIRDMQRSGRAGRVSSISWRRKRGSS